MKFGAHVSIAGGITNAPDNAQAIGCETFQIFTRSPRGGKPSEITKKIAEEFKAKCSSYGFEKYYVHTPYYINFISAKKRIQKGSIQVVRQELERSEKLGVTATMTHLGSAKDLSDNDKIIPSVAAGLIEMLKGYRGENQFLIEVAAGAGKVIGDSFEQIAEIIKNVEQKVKTVKIGVCFDTAHAFAVGYDLRSVSSVKKTVNEFHKTIGLDRMVLIHANDSLTPFADRKDRHENIGKGKIGKKGFAALVNHPKLKNTDCILETPWKDGEKTIMKDIAIMKRLRKQ